ncbi:hypothetical protein [Aeromicrobium duanguangcaii]|uniref:Uncharacterized protein n=1 Tax=Aeromicrobium duanguangcaii TaxID=2968086 RepID=A0ABY5KAB8_9ACTN|nr:hypothetical protein [Aeromicrobium duanguangcaii]MCD9152789.1 hypothetical protein [Aeromicrobium duanguangcaii]UUI67229.1 hypothetical protein NP095_08385 [Aeromicrobium duanguangcaii]
MQQLLGGVLVGTALVWVYSLLIPRSALRDRRFKSGRKPMTSWGSPEDAADWSAPVIALLALASLLPTDGTGAGTSGAILGAACALMPGALRPIRDAGLSILGAFAAVATVVSVLSPANCGGATAERAVVFFTSLGLFAAATLVSVVRRGINPTVGLEMFVIAELAAFLTAPLGLDLVGGQRLVGNVVAIALGLLVGLAPTFLMGVLALALAAASLWGSVLTSGSCGDLGSGHQMTTLICGAAAFLIVRGITTRFQGR